MKSRWKPVYELFCMIQLNNCPAFRREMDADMLVLSDLQARGKPVEIGPPGA